MFFGVDGSEVQYTVLISVLTISHRLLVCPQRVFLHLFFFCFARVGKMKFLLMYATLLVMDMHSLLTIHSILTYLALQSPLILLSLVPNSSTLFLLTRMWHRLLRLPPIKFTLISSRLAQQTLWWRLVRLIGVALTGEDPGRKMLQQPMDSKGMLQNSLQQIL